MEPKIRSKYYLYISPTKVRMLAEQIPRAMPQGQQLGLAHFLASAFTESELRRVLFAVGGESLLSSVPCTGVSLSDLAFDAYRALAHRNLIGDAFFRELERQRPGRAEEIRDIQALWEQFETRSPRGELSEHDQYRGLQAEDGGRLHPSVCQVVDWLEANAEVGTLAESRPYIRASMDMRFEAFAGWGAALAFFGGETASACIALIGAVTSLVGAFEVRASPDQHSVLLYLNRYLRRQETWMEREQAGARSSPEDTSSRFGRYENALFSRGYEIAMGLGGVPFHLEFVARVLLRKNSDGKQAIVASPIYVALAQ